MAEFKLVISDPKSGKSKQVEVKDDVAKGLIGKKIGDTFKGETIDMPGYEFQVTGGSDYAGFPMRGDVQGNSRKKITDVKSLGVKNKRHRPNPKKKGMRTMAGMKLKKTVAGNTVYDRSAQINLKILKMGRESLFEEPKPAEPAEAPKEEVKTEAPKEESKPKEEKKMDEPKEEVVENEEEVSEKTEEVPEKTEEVPIKSGEEVIAKSDSGDDAPSNPDGEDVGGAADAMSAPEEEKKSEETKTEEAPKEEEDDSASVEKETEEIEKEIAKDEEEIKKEDEEIEKIEKELAEAGKEDSSEEDKKEE